jgi:ABC-2 type transport system permease protein
MSTVEVGAPSGALRGELSKIPAFVERDFLTAWSYRASFVTDIVGLGGHVIVFYFVGRLVDSTRLPAYNGQSPSYLQWASVGIALGIFMHFALERVATAVRSEQLMGTFEAVLVTPTRTSTFQVGSVSFDLLYLPIRTAVFLGGIALAFGLHFDGGGIGPALLLMLAFVPFVWGLGLISAAAVVTFRRGAGAIGFGSILIGLLSGVYFPISLLPHWLAVIAERNPVALAINGMRESLIGGSGFVDTLGPLAVIVPASAASLVVGAFLFRLAMRREQRLGTLGLY